MYGIIMAGGVGKRFWPMSRTKKAKQFLRLFGERSMIQMTYERLRAIIDPQRILVVTNKKQARLTSEELPEIPAGNIIGEPLGKDTAPCIGLSALIALEDDPDAVMAVLPSDHLIQNVKEFHRILELGASLAREKECLITIGIIPTRPETGYGYVQIDKDPADHSLPEEYTKKDVFKVKTFAEKPNLETAHRFIESGDFLWNSGIFIWKATAILHQIEELLPELYETLLEVKNHINKPGFNKVLLTAYRQIKSISIDYGVMEKAQNVFLIKGDFGWSDVGSWEEYYNLNAKDDAGNVIIGSAVLNDSHNNLIISDKKLVATIGLDDMIVVNSNNVLLICPRGESQKVKELVDYLTRKQMGGYL
ncbi:mannose-1-phosphate guanylyltransferase [candidate division KSB1 bacterium]